jgi:hypothetical protein
MPRRTVRLILAFLLIGCGPSAPDPVQVEAVLGLRPEEPQRLGGPLDGLLYNLKSPIPNQMVVSEPGTYTWLYPIRTDSAYRPPPSSPLRCERVGPGPGDPAQRLTCQAEATDERGRWGYALDFRPEGGTGLFAASLRPE